MLNEDAIFLGHQEFLAIYKKGNSIEAACKKAGVEVKGFTGCYEWPS
ncbi:hypothetical protein [Secundilactobacillus kimchicus]|nr:hypothetical protein [Secundilactobacillus kimchicus]